MLWWTQDCWGWYQRLRTIFAMGRLSVLVASDIDIGSSGLACWDDDGVVTMMSQLSSIGGLHGSSSIWVLILIESEGGQRHNMKIFFCGRQHHEKHIYFEFTYHRYDILFYQIGDWSCKTPVEVAEKMCLKPGKHWSENPGQCMCLERDNFTKFSSQDTKLPEAARDQENFRKLRTWCWPGQDVPRNLGDIQLLSVKNS